MRASKDSTKQPYKSFHERLLYRLIDAKKRTRPGATTGRVRAFTSIFSLFCSLFYSVFWFQNLYETRLQILSPAHPTFFCQIIHGKNNRPVAMKKHRTSSSVRRQSSWLQIPTSPLLPFFQLPAVFFAFFQISA
jgi:hypothetical protein